MALSFKDIEFMNNEIMKKVIYDPKTHSASFYTEIPVMTLPDGPPPLSFDQEQEFLDLSDGDEVGVMPIGDEPTPTPTPTAYQQNSKIYFSPVADYKKAWASPPPATSSLLKKPFNPWVYNGVGVGKGTGKSDWVDEKGNMLFGKKKVKSQKARGVLMLGRSKVDYSHETQGMSVATVNHLIGVDEGVSPLVVWFPQFARPCPITPRHGFVESRVVHDMVELEQVIKETRHADPDGEVMLMDEIKSILNVVWTPSLLTIGAGHDGATGGKGAMTFPLTGTWDAHIAQLAPRCGVDDYPYVEAVIEQRSYGSYLPRAILTQLRNGPILDSKPDYIPDEVVVTRVISPDVERGDLLEWEKLMLESRGVVGVVVWHPGGSQGDHFSVHARSCGIPCVTSKEPKIGDTLIKVERTEEDYQSVLRGLVAGSVVPLEKSYPDLSNSSFKDVATTMLVGLHNSSAMEGEQAWWLGASVSLMLRLGSMALRGEARHLNPSKGSREEVYRKAANMKMQAHHERTNALINIFRYGWEQGAKGIGGIAWAQCGLSLANLFNATGEFVKDPSKSTYGALLMAFNVTVNQAHNGGWWMNKFVQKETFDQAQEGSIRCLTDAVPFMWDLNKEYKDLSDERFARVIGQWGQWQPISLTPSRVMDVSADLPLNSHMLTLTIRDRLIGSKRPAIKLNLVNVLKKVPIGWVPEFDLIEGETGMVLEMTFPGKMSGGVVVWRERPLTTQELAGEVNKGAGAPPTAPSSFTATVSSASFKVGNNLGIVNAPAKNFSALVSDYKKMVESVGNSHYEDIA